MPKKTPVNSSHRMPDNRTVGPQTASPKRLLPRFRPSLVCFTCAVVRTVFCASRATGEDAAERFGVSEETAEGAPTEEAGAAVFAEGEDGFACAAAEGLGAVAASTAVTRVLAAARAPIPSARPKRTESISESVAVSSRDCEIFVVCKTPAKADQRFHASRIQRWKQDGKGDRVMKNIFWLIGGFCAAAAGFLFFGPQRIQPVELLAHRLEEAWSDHHTVV